MDWNRVEGNWKQMKGKIKEQWGKLTDDDITVINGERDQLLGKLQPARGLDEVIEDMSRQAPERGLTPEILEVLLRDGD